MSSRGWEQIGTILKPLFARLALEEKVALDRLRREWSQIFSEPLSRHTGPADLDKGTLVIAVDTPVWLQQLKFFREEILEKLRSHGIGDVRFKLGRVYDGHPGWVSADAHPHRTARNAEPSESELRWIDETLSPVDDGEVREALKRALRKSLGRPSNR